MPPKLLFALLAATITVPVMAQDDVHCDLTDTPAECWNRFVPALAALTVTEESATMKMVNTANAGSTNVASPTGSVLKDFLSLISFALDTSSLSQNGQTFSFDWNPPMGGLHPFKLQAVLSDPTVSGSVSSALAGNPAALTAVNDALSSTSEITVSGTYTLANSTHGRSIAPHGSLFGSLLAPALPNASMANFEMSKALVAAGVDFSNFSTHFDELKLDVKGKRLLMNAVEDAARANQPTLKFADHLTRAFAKLLNNQPQFYVSGLYRNRTPVAGPDEVILKANYEYGFKNLNTFRKRYANCDSAMLATAVDLEAAAKQCVAVLEDYAGDTTGPDTGTDSGRLAVALEYHWADANSVSLPQYALQLDTEKGHSFVASLAYGRVVAPRPDRKSGRLDVSVSYEDISNAAAIPSISNPSDDIKDRWIGSITYTQKISDTLSFPISLVYANHASYLPDVDRALNAHFGIQYKMPSK